MPLGVISRVSFGLLRIFEGNLKSAKRRKTGQTRAPTSMRREPTPQHSLTLQRGMPRHGKAEMPHHGKAEMPKRAPLGYATT